MLQKRDFGSLNFFVVDDGADLNIEIFKELDFKSVAEISFEEEKSTLFFLIIGKERLSLEPGIYSDAFTEDPLRVVIKYFDSIDGGVLDKVKVGEDISLLDTSLDKSKRSLNHLERQLFRVIFST